MSTSTDGQICFGVIFEEGYEFPWGYDIESWWLAENEYKPPFQMYDSCGEYIKGQKFSEEQINEIYNHKQSFLKKHPIPVEVVNYCAGECPMFILALPGTVKTASRGYPLRFDPKELDSMVPSFDIVQTLRSFCKKYELKYQGPPSWFLSSYWG